MGEDLRSRAALAVLGNSLDFFTHSEKTISSLTETIEAGRVPARYLELRRIICLILFNISSLST